ncbi:two component sensor histidine kinase ChvG [Commensalibacter papalotli (ex Servin-Garciduenas et al. 2014)]|uniref:histidine kinase n=2 Tax=Commensalibacter papalotli (ex Servin-Garciduenas et al. 2014) TaxID=1208583 RepID=W7E4E6_9PROT|nr:stimulus-sensing domain-containing protein [Commensalibacter papalotli (ex Servin-Garciduenas et al. 2014)]EUK17961.1 two component sensor histidine kinase ChvG [Commensalibacter papalotli (ex Servin-Garciduenas et al. 2014)]
MKHIFSCLRRDKADLTSKINYKARFSSLLMRRILLVNALPLVVLVATLLYLNQFQNSLLETEVTALREQAKIYAGALGQSATRKIKDQMISEGGFEVMFTQKPIDIHFLSVELAQPLLLSLTEPSPNVRARVYAPDGQLVVDSGVEGKEKQYLYKQGAQSSLPSYNKKYKNEFHKVNTENEKVINTRYDTVLEKVYTHLLSWMPYSGERKIKNLSVNADPEAVPNAVKKYLQFTNDPNSQEMPPYIRRAVDHRLLITISEPIVHQGKTVGIIQLTREATNVDKALFAVRSSILVLFLLALIITVLMSWYLSLTIARPLLVLAIATHRMRDSVRPTGMVPQQLLSRKDEIGDLARALQDSAKALWTRMGAIERFAADVSHELKNPLSSIRSAIELLPRISDPEHKKRLFYVVRDDVSRLDRLITDIASSSRIETEMSRTTPEAVEVMPIYKLLSELYEATYKPNDPHIIVEIDSDPHQQNLKVLAVEDRLVQVLRNLIGNAISFSPPNGLISLSVKATKDRVELIVSDQGPGIPENKLNSIFERFYTERPEGENFGQHSGLGLSICRQIVVALKGTIQAHNQHDEQGKIVGARFIVSLPRVI